jgi:hypothetical protein
MRYDEPRLVWTSLTTTRIVCERRVARRKGARARRSVPVNPIPNPDPSPNQAQMSEDN